MKCISFIYISTIIGLKFLCKFSSGISFKGKEALEDIANHPIKRRLFGFAVDELGIPGSDYHFDPHQEVKEHDGMLDTLLHRNEGCHECVKYLVFVLGGVAVTAFLPPWTTTLASRASLAITE